MKPLLIEYPPCGSCKKAKKYLNESNIDFETRHIVENTPTEDELLKWIELSGLEPKKFFNTSGKKYKELNLKDKVKNISNPDAAKLLSSDGMLIKRPIFLIDDKVYVGFKEYFNI
ncbi:MAG: spxA [Bacillales bacterium]|jgi:arsenate reductase|nr:spxA [Bacillales bacterium]